MRLIPSMSGKIAGPRLDEASPVSPEPYRLARLGEQFEAAESQADTESQRALSAHTIVAKAFHVIRYRIATRKAGRLYEEGVALDISLSHLPEDNK